MILFVLIVIEICDMILKKEKSVLLTKWEIFMKNEIIFKIENVYIIDQWVQLSTLFT